MNQIITLHMAVATVCTFFVKMKEQQHFKTFYLWHRDVSETAGRMISSLLQNCLSQFASRLCVCSSLQETVTSRLHYFEGMGARVARHLLVVSFSELQNSDLRKIHYLYYPFLFTVFHNNNNNNNNNNNFLIRQESNPYFGDKLFHHRTFTAAMTGPLK